jgi:hypothetical protein
LEIPPVDVPRNASIITVGVGVLAEKEVIPEVLEYLKYLLRRRV